MANHKKVRDNIPRNTRVTVLTEAGYRCAVPRCQGFLTLALHHLDYVSEGGGGEAENLIALCPNCHARHHAGFIPREALIMWKASIRAANSPYDRPAFDLMRMLEHLGGTVRLEGTGALQFARLIGPGLVSMACGTGDWLPQHGDPAPTYEIMITPRGRAVLEAWTAGDPTKYQDAVEASLT